MFDLIKSIIFDPLSYPFQMSIMFFIIVFVALYYYNKYFFIHYQLPKDTAPCIHPHGYTIDHVRAILPRIKNNKLIMASLEKEGHNLILNIDELFVGKKKAVLGDFYGLINKNLDINVYKDDTTHNTILELNFISSTDNKTIKVPITNLDNYFWHLNKMLGKTLASKCVVGEPYINDDMYDKALRKINNMLNNNLKLDFNNIKNSLGIKRDINNEPINNDSKVEKAYKGKQLGNIFDILNDPDFEKYKQKEVIQ